MLKGERPRKVVHGIGLPPASWQLVENFSDEGEKRADFIHAAILTEVRFRMGRERVLAGLRASPQGE